jgi:hypothetical protein
MNGVHRDAAALKFAGELVRGEKVP